MKKFKEGQKTNMQSERVREGEEAESSLGREYLRSSGIKASSQ